MVEIKQGVVKFRIRPKNMLNILVLFSCKMDLSFPKHFLKLYGLLLQNSLKFRSILFWVFSLEAFGYRSILFWDCFFSQSFRV